MSHDYAHVAAVIGKTENWVKRNAWRLPHHRYGKSYTFTDGDIAEIQERAQRRPGAMPAAETSGVPKPGRRTQ